MLSNLKILNDPLFWCSHYKAKLDCSAIENDDYNYMSATYFLLAERVLASCRFERAKELTEENRENSLPEEEPLERFLQTDYRALWTMVC